MRKEDVSSFRKECGSVSLSLTRKSYRRNKKKIRSMTIEFLPINNKTSNFNRKMRKKYE
jgi:hypothetical protein